MRTAGAAPGGASPVRANGRRWYGGQGERGKGRRPLKRLALRTVRRTRAGGAPRPHSTLGGPALSRGRRTWQRAASAASPAACRPHTPSTSSGRGSPPPVTPPARPASTTCSERSSLPTYTCAQSGKGEAAGSGGCTMGGAVGGGEGRGTKPAHRADAHKADAHKAGALRATSAERSAAGSRPARLRRRGAAPRASRPRTPARWPASAPPARRASAAPPWARQHPCLCARSIRGGGCAGAGGDTRAPEESLIPRILRRRAP